MPSIFSGDLSPTLAAGVVALAAVIFPLSAQADDEPSPVMKSSGYDWRGPYLGALFGLNSFSTTHGDLSGSPRSARAKGRIAGIVAGYNFRKADLVFGPEVDISYGLLKTTAEGDEIEDDVFSSLRLRFGYRYRRALPYITAGLAIHKVNYEEQLDSAGDGGWQPSFAIGAGTEFSLARALSARVEYFHVRGLKQDSYRNKADGHMVRASAIYHIGK